MTRRVTMQGRDWATPSTAMPPARRAHVHGPLQPMVQDRPGFGECVRLAITTALIVFAIGSVWAVFG